MKQIRSYNTCQAHAILNEARWTYSSTSSLPGNASRTCPTFVLPINGKPVSTDRNNSGQPLRNLITRMLRGGKARRGDGGGWVTPVSPSAVCLPTVCQGNVAALTDQLPRELQIIDRSIPSGGDTPRAISIPRYPLG